MKFPIINETGELSNFERRCGNEIKYVNIYIYIYICIYIHIVNIYVYIYYIYIYSKTLIICIICA